MYIIYIIKRSNKEQYFSNKRKRADVFVDDELSAKQYPSVKAVKNMTTRISKRLSGDYSIIGVGWRGNG